MRKIFGLILLLALFAASCSGTSGDSTSSDESSVALDATESASAAQATPTLTIGDDIATSRPGQPAVVVDVIDGDTIDVVLDGAEERVRYIGIDSPERGVCFEDEATAANAALVEGRDVLLEADIENDRDSFGRLLRYVHVDGLFVNEELVRLGVAEATTRFPERAYRDVLLAAEAEAKAEGRGLWSACPGLFE